MLGLLLAGLAGRLLSGGAALAGRAGLARTAGVLQTGALGAQHFAAAGRNGGGQDAADPGGGAAGGSTLAGPPNWSTVQVGTLNAQSLNVATPPLAGGSGPSGPHAGAPLSSSPLPSGLPASSLSGGSASSAAAEAGGGGAMKVVGMLGRAAGVVGLFAGAVASTISAIKGMGEASLSAEYALKARFDPRIAQAQAQDKRQQLQLTVQSARNTGGATAGLAEAMRGLRKDLQPLGDVWTRISLNFQTGLVNATRTITKSIGGLAAAFNKQMNGGKGGQPPKDPDREPLNNALAQWIRDTAGAPAERQPRHRPPRPPGGARPGAGI